jgi:hypothetical protein
VLVLLILAVVVVAALSAFGSGGRSAVGVSIPASASRLLPAGPPSPLVVAIRDDVRLQLPINQSQVTAIGYYGGGDGLLALDPVGHRLNEGFASRVVQRIFGGGGGGPGYYQLSGGTGPSTGVLNVGAAPGVDVYAPVDGVVVGLRDDVINGEKLGSRIEIQPAGQPGIVVAVSGLRADPALTVGSPVASGISKIGAVVDLSGVERLALARYTQDAGNHVSIELHAAESLAMQ